MTTSETHSRLITWVGPEIFREAVKSGRYPTGLELMRAILDGELPRPPIAELLDYWPVAVDKGRTVYGCRVQPFHYSPLGMAHGGLAATLCDTAMACSIHTLLPIEVGYTTLELKVNFIRPLTQRTGEISCTGQVIHSGGRTATAEARIEDASGRLYAHSTTTCLMLGGVAPRLKESRG